MALVAQSCNTLRTAAVAAALLALTACGAAAQPPGEVPDDRDSAEAVAAGTWHQVPVSPAGSLLGPVLTWDGHELLQIGGTAGEIKGADGATVDGPALTDTVAFSPASGRWRRLDPAPFPVAAQQAASAWTGRQLFVLTSHGAAMLTPSSGRWRTLTSPPVSGLDSATAVWSGGRVVVATPRTPSEGDHTQVAVYDPGTDRWTRIDPPLITGHDQRSAPLVATPDGVVLFSLWSHSVSRAIRGATMTTVQSGVDVLRLTRHARWTPLAADWPQHETVSAPLLTDVGVIVPAGQIWCGDCSHPAPMNEHGYLADPRTLHGQAMPHGPLDDTDPQPLWTGRALIAIAQGDITGPGISITSGDLAVWDPATDRWTRAARSPGALDYRTAPVWGDHQMFAIDLHGHPVAFEPALPTGAGGKPAATQPSNADPSPVGPQVSG